MSVRANQPIRVMFYTRYFPGWAATLDGAPVSVEAYGEQGLIAVQVPPGEHIVSIHFGETPARQVGALVSLLSLAGAMVWLWKTRVWVIEDNRNRVCVTFLGIQSL